MTILIHSPEDAKNVFLRSELARIMESLAEIQQLVEEIADPRLPAKPEILHHCRSLSAAAVKLRLQLRWEHPMQVAFRGEFPQASTAPVMNGLSRAKGFNAFREERKQLDAAAAGRNDDQQGRRVGRLP